MYSSVPCIVYFIGKQLYHPLSRGDPSLGQKIRAEYKAYGFMHNIIEREVTLHASAKVSVLRCALRIHYSLVKSTYC